MRFSADMRWLLAIFMAFAAAGTASAQREAERGARFGVAAFDSIAQDRAGYGKLLDKFVKGVERPSVGECTIVYYGFAMQPGFRGDVDGAPEAETAMQQAVTAGDYGAAYALGVRALESNPVGLAPLYWTLHAATETRQPWEVRNSLRARYNGITHIISLSGDGLSPETAFRVICAGDMYIYTAMELGLEIGEGFLWDGRWTELRVKPAPGFKHTSIFFEIWDAK